MYELRMYGLIYGLMLMLELMFGSVLMLELMYEYVLMLELVYGSVLMLELMYGSVLMQEQSGILFVFGMGPSEWGDNPPTQGSALPWWRQLSQLGKNMVPLLCMVMRMLVMCLTRATKKVDDDWPRPE